MLRAGLYRSDADGIARSPGQSAPTCIQFDDTGLSDISVAAVAPTGQAFSTGSLAIGPRQTTALTGDLELSGTGSDTPTGLHWDFQGTPGAPVEVRSAEASVAVRSATLKLDLTDGVYGRFSGTYRLETPNGPIEGVVEGEALQSGSDWVLRGFAQSSGLRAGPSTGGFRARIVPSGTGWRAVWAFDGTTS
jgi:hypothetical protein